MDCVWVSRGSRSMSQNCPPHSARHSRLRQTCSAFGYPMKFSRCKNGTAIQWHRPCWTGTKGKVTTFLDESSLWTKLGLARTNQTWNGSTTVILFQRKCAVYNVLWRGCSLLRWWENTAPRCTSKANGKRCLLLHVPAAPLSSSAQEKTTILGGTEPPSFFMTVYVVTDFLDRWEILEHPPCSPVKSPCDYHLFAKVKEPLRGIWYNIRDELLRAIGWSMRNINKDERADGVRRLSNIWQNVINKGATILKVHKYCAPVNKAMSEISNCCHYFILHKGGVTILKVRKCCIPVNKALSEISNCCHYFLSNPCIIMTRNCCSIITMSYL